MDGGVDPIGKCLSPSPSRTSRLRLPPPPSLLHSQGKQYKVLVPKEREQPVGNEGLTGKLRREAHGIEVTSGEAEQASTGAKTGMCKWDVDGEKELKE